MKKQVMNFCSILLVALVCVAFTGDEKKQYGDLFQKIKSHMNPAGDHFVACNYAFFKDSLATQATHTLQVKRWKVGNREVTQTELMHVIKEGDRQLIIDKESKIIAFGPFNPQGGLSSGYEMYLDSLMASSRVQLTRNTGSTSTLLVRYPWSMPISASILTFDHNNYRPKKARLYTRVPQLIAEDEWAVQPRIDIEYQRMELGAVKVPETFGKYLQETEQGYQLQEAYRAYEFINQFND